MNVDCTQHVCDECVCGLFLMWFYERLLSMWYLENVVFYDHGLLWTCSTNNVSVMKVVGSECDLLSTWSVFNMLSFERVLSWTWSVMNVVCCDCSWLWTWSLMNMVCCEGGGLWTCSVMNGSKMNVVCYEHGLLRRVVCYERWSVMNGGLFWTWSVTNMVGYESGLKWIGL